MNTKRCAAYAKYALTHHKRDIELLGPPGMAYEFATEFARKACLREEELGVDITIEQGCLAISHAFRHELIKSLAFKDFLISMISEIEKKFGSNP